MKLEVHAVSKKYPSKQALQDISFTLQNGVYGLVGPNGAGKTTLLSILVNTLDATSGYVMYDGKTTESNMEDYLGKIGYLPQYPKFYGSFRCIEFLRYMCMLKDIPKKQISEKIEYVLSICNLEKDKNRKIKEFSGGMRQRLGIAQAIINNPQLLILDEPTAGLDPMERIRFRNIISDLSTQRIVILATHIMEDVESIAQKVILIKAGILLGIKNTTQMLNELTDKVWIVKLPEEQVAAFKEHHIISNIAHEENVCQIRFLSDMPVAGSIAAEPKLEEVYLYYFHQEEA